MPGSREAEVDHLWTNLLGFYFSEQNDYGVLREAYIRARSQSRANVCVCTLHRRTITKVIVVENKRASEAQTGIPPLSSWTHAKQQLQNYMLNIRPRQPQWESHTMFGILGVGKYVKFLQLRAGQNELEYFQDDGMYHLEDEQDSFTIEQKLSRMRNYISARREYTA